MELSQEEEYTAFLKASMGKSCGSQRRFITFCREILFMGNKEIDWSANVRYVDKLISTLADKVRGIILKVLFL